MAKHLINPEQQFYFVLWLFSSLVCQQKAVRVAITSPRVTLTLCTSTLLRYDICRGPSRVTYNKMHFSRVECNFERVTNTHVNLLLVRA